MIQQIAQCVLSQRDQVEQHGIKLLIIMVI